MLKPNIQLFILSQTNNTTKENVLLNNILPSIRDEYIAKQHVLYLKPISKIFKKKFFFNNCWKTNYHTMDPRPETEEIVELIMKNHSYHESFSILELGVGTGCLIGTILKLFPKAQGTGVEISKSAIRVARYNFKRLNIKCKIFCSNWLNNIKKPFDILISNPPYLSIKQWMGNPQLYYDPKISLVSEDQLFFYKKISEKQYLFKEIYLECPLKIAFQVKKLFSSVFLIH